MVAVTAAIVVFGVPLGVAVQRSYHDEAVLSLEREATSAAGSIPASFATSGDPADLPIAPPGVRLSLYRIDAVRLVGGGPKSGDAPVHAAASGRITDSHVRGQIIVAVPVASEERVFAVVRASESDAPLTSRVHRAWALMAGLALVIMGGAGLLAWLQSRRLARPVVELTHAVGRVGWTGPRAGPRGRAYGY